MGVRQSKGKRTKRLAYMASIESNVTENLRRPSMIPTMSDMPTPFTKFQVFSEEWNLCGKYDSTRCVNVVSDPKLLRKRLPHLYVEKSVKKRATESVQSLRIELEMLMFLLRFAQLNIGYMHPNIIRLRGYYSFRKKIHIFLEFCELGSLKTAYITDPSPLLRINFAPIESEVRDFMRQIVSGVAFLHTNGIAHCDLALENIFVNSENMLKIGDFDHAVFVGTENQWQTITVDEPLRRIYGAPEIFGAAAGDGRALDLQKMDVWALGIILIQLYTKKPMFDSTDAEDKGFQLFLRVGLRQYVRAMYIEQTAICKFSEDMLSLLESLLIVDPVQRTTAAQALESKWLRVEAENERQEPTS